MAPNVGVSHRLFLQAMLSRGFVTFAEAEKLWDECRELAIARAPKSSVKTEKQLEAQNLRGAIDACNQLLDDSHLEMLLRTREMVEYAPTERFVVLCNTRSDEISKQFGSRFDENDTRILRACVALMVQASNGLLTREDYLNLDKEVLGRTKRGQVADVLEQFAADGWLKRRGGVDFLPGPRLMLELSEHLRTLGAPECNVTKQVVLKTPGYRKWLKNQQSSDEPHVSLPKTKVNTVASKAALELATSGLDIEYDSSSSNEIKGENSEDSYEERPAKKKKRRRKTS